MLKFAYGFCFGTALGLALGLTAVPAHAQGADKPVVMLVTLVGPSGPAVALDDSEGDKGAFADMTSCQADVLHASNKLQDDIFEHKVKIFVLSIVCFDTRQLTQSE